MLKLFLKQKMVKGEDLQVVNERMATIDVNEIDKFLGVEQANEIKKKEVCNRVTKKLVEI